MPEKQTFHRSIALVSGKGGSGKTLVAAQMAQVMASAGFETVLVDADVGTAGLSYYLGLKHVRNIRNGLSTLARVDDDRDYAIDVLDLLVPLRDIKDAKLLPVGDHRVISRLLRDREQSPNVGTLLRRTIEQLHLPGVVTIVDCRGGIDDESLAVCHAVDDIFLVVEPDTTAYQASRHLVDVLSDNRLADKVQGFLINKVYSNPITVVQHGTSDFGAQALACVPFDFDAMRSFLIGDLPAMRSPFGVHVQDALSRAYSGVIKEPTGRIWDYEDYADIKLAKPGLRMIDVITTLAALSAGVVFLLLYLSNPALFSQREMAILIIILACAPLASLLGGFWGMLRRRSRTRPRP